LINNAEQSANREVNANHFKNRLLGCDDSMQLHLKPLKRLVQNCRCRAEKFENRPLGPNIFMVPRWGGLTANQSKTRVLLGFRPVLGASCVPDSGETTAAVRAYTRSRHAIVRHPYIYADGAVKPLSDPSLCFNTCVILRADNSSRLIEEYVRMFLRKYAPQRLSEAYVYGRIRLADLIPPVAEAFLKDQITIGHALLIAKLPASQQQEAFSAAFRGLWTSEGNSQVLIPVRELALCDAPHNAEHF
jgi:hypothetical protein